MKALGTGWRRGIRWVDLEVVREQSGRPSISLAGEAAKIAAQLGVKRISLSITHTEAQAWRRLFSRISGMRRAETQRGRLRLHSCGV